MKTHTHNTDENESMILFFVFYATLLSFIVVYVATLNFVSIFKHWRHQRIKGEHTQNKQKNEWNVYTLKFTRKGFLF